MIFYIFLEYLIIKLLAKRIKLNLFFKPSYLSSNFALTLGYLIKRTFEQPDPDR